MRISPWLPADGLMWGALFVIAAWLRFDFDAARTIDLLDHVQFALVVAGTILLVWTLGFLAGIYRGRFVPGSIHETSTLIAVFFASSLISFISISVAFESPHVPRSLPLSSGAFATTTALVVRFIVRRNQLLGAGAKEHEIRAIVFGAGNAGRRLVNILRHSSASPFLPVAILDDDPS